ncbi:MAG: adenylyltransferase/cytidyltransferase family protein [Bacteroidetes bacterium]|nr:adenylyltransferase/cytidyltransferase family protein [Bacteroidota bacterium]
MKVGFACGIFDLFHAGHVLMLKECKEHCNYLIVALNKAENINKHINPDKNEPIYTLEERKLIMESCRYVDEVMIYNSEEELVKIMSDPRIDIRFLGEDYKDHEITAPDLIKEIYYTSRAHGLSTSKYRQLICERNLKK